MHEVRCAADVPERPAAGEFARGVEPGQAADAEDDLRPGAVWKGRVKHVSRWFLNRREVLDDLSQNREARTLECIIELAPGQPPLRIGQRVRVTFEGSSGG